MTIPLLPIETQRLKLRKFCRADLAEFQAYRCDEELAKFQGWQPMTDEDACAFLVGQSKQELGAQGQWLQVAVVKSDPDRLIGDIGLCVTDAQLGIVNMGFTIARAHQRNGIATEALSAVLARLFEFKDINKVVAVTDDRNIATISLLQRLGFTLAKTEPAVFRDFPCIEHTFEYMRQ